MIVVSKYIDLLNAFIGGRMDAAEFSHAYFTMYNVESNLEVYDLAALKELFWIVEDYVSDPMLRGPDDVSDLELLERVKLSLASLVESEFS